MRRRAPSSSKALSGVMLIAVLALSLALPIAAHAATYRSNALPVLELRSFTYGGVTYQMTPTGVAYDAAGNIYVGDSANGCVVKFSPAGRFLAVWGSNFVQDGPMMDSPHGMVFDAAGYLYVANYSNDVIKVDRTGHEVDFYTDPECAGIRPSVCCVTDIALGPDGRLYAASDDFDVYVFDPNDYYANTVFATTGAQGFGIAVDPGGRVYWSDYDNASVARYLPSGGLDPAWGAAGHARGTGADGTGPGLVRPAQLRLDSAGNVLVADEGSGAVVVLDPSGASVARWPQDPASAAISPALTAPLGLALKGDLVLVADPGGDRAVGYRFTEADAVPATAGAAGSGPMTIASNVSVVRMPKAFVLSGALAGGEDGDPCVVWVRKPGSSRWSYSSARLAYGASGGSAKWWYRYAPKLRGTYSFNVRSVGDAGAPAGMSRTITVTVR